MEHYDWNDGWLFTPVFDPAIVRPECPELTLEPVRLPHTVKALPYNYCNENDYQKLSGYRREFFAPKEWEGRTVLLTFGAVAHDATVFCNGRRVFHHSCGYTAFTVDLTSALHLGQKNVVAVRCDSREDLNIPPFGGQMDFLTYGGICRAVCLDVKEPAYLRDIFIETKAEGGFRIYTATVGETVGCTLQAEIRSPSGSRAFYTGELSLPITGALNSVHPWSIEHPTLYTLTVRLIRPGTGGLPDRVLDEKSCRFGFRTLQFVAGGLYLNGQRVELRGLNRRQSYAYQGYAMPDSIQRLDAQLLKKQLGCNAVRLTAPPSPAFLDACDELGLLVFVEMPGWQHIGDEAWQAQALQNCREMVCQCRNHPSVFLWGVRVNGSSDNEAFYKRTNEAVHRLDPTRPTGGVRIARKSQLLEDVYAYNDYSYSGRGPGCEPRSAVTPDLRKGYLISEFGGQQFPAKAFDDEPHRLAQALRHAAVLNDAIAQQGVAGALGWCMADYNTHREFGSGDRICYHGVTDMFRVPKLAAALYASQQDDTPVMEISSSMDIGEHPGSQLGQVYAFTNCDYIKLYKNGVYVSTAYPNKKAFPHLPHPPVFTDDFIGDALTEKEHLNETAAKFLKPALVAGSKYAFSMPKKYFLMAGLGIVTSGMKIGDMVSLVEKYIGGWGDEQVSYRFEGYKDGQLVKTAVKTAVAETKLDVRVDNPELVEADTYDVTRVALTAVDQNGNRLPFASNAVTVHVEGPAEVIGPKSFALIGGDRAFWLRTKGASGEAVVTITVEHMGTYTCKVQVTKRQ